jgi:protein-tyrosine phosphatase
VIIPGLWQGGCLYNQSRSGRSITQAIVPDDTFDVIVSVYQGATNYGPGLGHPAHYVFPFVDEEALSDYALKQLKKATEVTSQAVTEGASVLVRCQAGLNRSGLVVASTLIQLGYKPEDAVQIIRARRSPWALCNETFVNHLLAQELVATPC